MTKFYGLIKSDVEMIRDRYLRSKGMPGNQLVRIKTIPARKKGYFKEIQFETIDEVIAFKVDSYKNEDEMFHAILVFLNSIKVY